MEMVGMINEIYKETSVKPCHGNILTYTTKRLSAIKDLDAAKNKLKQMQDEELFNENIAKALKHIEIATEQIKKTLAK